MSNLLEIINPSTEEVIKTVPIYKKEELDEKVQQAHNAQRPWEQTPAQNRGNYLRLLSNRLEENRDIIARTMSRDTGKPLTESLDEVDVSVRLFRYYSEVGRLIQGGVAPMMTPKQRSYVLKEAVGVVGAILPFNFPLLLFTWKAAPALMAGCTMVVKPPHQNPSTLLLIEELCLKELPPGVVVVVTGDGSTGSLMVEHPQIRMITFTGSTAVGRKIAERCGSQLKKYHLELGGMDPLLVLDDANIELAARAACWGRFCNSGQVCTSTKRIIVTNAVADRFVARLVELTSALRQGDPLAGETIDIGPVINKLAMDKLLSQIDTLKNEPGARLLHGGRQNPKFSKGYFLEPTVFDGLTSSSLANNEEIFGPVACVFRVENKEEAFTLANSNEYGLGGSVFTNRLDYTMDFIDNMKAGTIWVNDVISDNESAPFGGMKNSGDGTRELGGLESLECYRESKHVITDWNLKPKSFWFPYE